MVEKDPGGRARAALPRIGALVVALAALAIAYRVGLLSELAEPKRLAADLVAMGAWGYVAFVVTCALLQPFGIPGTAFVVAAALVWPWPIACALSMVAIMASSVIGFSFARFVARDFVAARIPARLRRYESALERRAFRTVVILRLVFWMAPTLHFFLGVSKVPFRTHFWASLLAYVPTLVVLSYAGSAILDAEGHLQTRAWPLFAALFAASIVVAAASRFLERRSKREPV